jgi:hypothetical protein
LSEALRIRPGGSCDGDAATIVDFQLRLARETEDLELTGATPPPRASTNGSG